jgi:peroxiredoxin
MPRWTRGQELVYGGTVREQCVSGGVQFNTAWKLEARAFVLDMDKVDAKVAFLTKLSPQRAAQAETKESHDEIAIRLDVADVDGLGRLTPPKNTSAAIALDGPTAWEWGFLLHSPPGAIRIGQSWTTQVPGQPMCKYRLDDTELVGSTSCLRVVMEQQSEDWDTPRADSMAWKRKDTLWLMPRLGVASRVRREIQRLEPAHRDATYALTTEYDMDTSLEYKGQFFEDRRRDVLEAKHFEESRRDLLAGQQPPKAFTALLTQMDRYVERSAPTPYRDALLRVRGRVVSNRDGVRESPAPAAQPPARLVIGKPAPDFVVQDFVNRQAIPLSSWRGKPVIMLFYQPGGGTARLALQYAEYWAEQYTSAAVVGFSINDDAATVKSVQQELHLTFPTLPGKALIHSYEVSATPRFVLLDAEGVVRGKYLGWGPETAPALEAELKKLLGPVRK